MGPQYVGNNDYRGYLNSLQSNVGGPDAGLARQLLGLDVGNDAGFNRAVAPGLQSGAQRLYGQFHQQGPANPSYLAGANILSGSGGNYATPPPNWDLNAIYNQAGAGAAAQVNPYYSKQLTDFVTQQQNARQQEYNQYNFNLQNLQQELTNSLQGNEISRGRTSADTLTKEQQIGQQADIRQQDQGQQFDEARIAQAKQIAQQGLTGSGQGNNQTLQSQTTRNTQEARQGVQDQQDVTHQELLKARTFEDLARSDVLAGQVKTKGEKQYRFDIDAFIQGQSEKLQEKQQNLETERLGRLSQVQQQLAQQDINARIHALSNPNVRAAAAQAYGSSF